jgi:hypothetical protein
MAAYNDGPMHRPESWLGRSPRRHRALGAALLVGATLALFACRDLSSYSTGSGSDQGPVVSAAFVRSGIGGDAGLCLTLDTNHLQDAPGTISTSDGMFEATPMRPIPQIWQDPLSTFNFGEGRVKNLLYVATPQPESGSTADTMVIVSLMDSGGVEVRLVRGAPGASSDGGALPINLFAVFSLTKQSTPCPY